jgi:hypothetical protein
MAKLNLQNLEKQVQEIQHRQSGSGTRGELKWYEMKSGVNQVRILEPTFEDGRLAMVTVRHKEANNYFCIARTWPQLRKDCPICKVMWPIYEANKESPIAKYFPKRNAWVNVIDRSNPDLGVQLMRLPISLHDDLITQISTRDMTDPTKFIYGDITDSQNGRDIIITRNETHGQVSYTIAIHPMVTPLHKDPGMIQKWLDERYNIEKIFSTPDDAGMKAIEEFANKISIEFSSPTNQSNHNTPQVPPPPQPTAAAPNP